jgi:hypothetical protein
VNRRPISEDHEAAGHLPEHVIEKGDDIGGIDGLAMVMKIQLALGRDGADGRTVVAGPSLPENRCVAHRGIRPDHTGQWIESGFIYEEDALPVGLCPLLRAGYVSSRQRAMAASSRCRARRAGFCRLHRSVFSKRPTWLG